MDFPEPVVRAISALNEKERRRILLILRKAGAISYSEIMEKLERKVTKGTLTHHLKILVSAGLVRQFIMKKTPYSSYYELTHLCERIIDNIFKAFEGPSYSTHELADKSTQEIISTIPPYYTTGRPLSEFAKTYAVVIRGELSPEAYYPTKSPASTDTLAVDVGSNASLRLFEPYRKIGGLI